MKPKRAKRLAEKLNLPIIEKRSHIHSKTSLAGASCNSLFIIGYVGNEYWVWRCEDCKVVGKSKETRLRKGVCRCRCDPLINKGAIRHGAYSTIATKKALLAYNKMRRSGIQLIERWEGQQGFTNFLVDMGAQPASGWILYIHPKATICNSKTVRWVDNSLQLYKKHPLTFNSYRAMLDRCSNLKRYLHVKICDRWLYGEGSKLPFTCFFEDMGPRTDKSLTIDRINGKKGYNPSNCRWADSKTQRINQLSRVHKISSKGETLTIQDIASRSGLTWSQVSCRLKKGMRPSTIIKHALMEAA